MSIFPLNASEYKMTGHFCDTFENNKDGEIMPNTNEMSHERSTRKLSNTPRIEIEQPLDARSYAETYLGSLNHAPKVAQQKSVSQSHNSLSTSPFLKQDRARANSKVYQVPSLYYETSERNSQSDIWRVKSSDVLVQNNEKSRNNTKKAACTFQQSANTNNKMVRHSLSLKNRIRTPKILSSTDPEQSQSQKSDTHQNQLPQERRSGFENAMRHRLQGSNTSKKFLFVFDPAGRLCYYWSMVVSLAFLYNFWVIIYRFSFQEINEKSILIWFCFDYFADLFYLIDILFHFRTAYLEDGVLQTDSVKLRNHYMNSTTFYIDCLCLLPLDFLYLSIGFNSILRSFRLVKIYRFWAFMDRTERHTNYPNLFRSVALTHYLLVIFHWNGCLYNIIHKNNGFGSRNWVFHDSESADIAKQYLQSFYWCTLALTTIGDLPKPRSKGEYVFVILQLLFGLMLFATVLGHVANIVTSVSAARKEFQAKLDGVKTYMRMRRVPCHLQVKVIKWFDYLWLTQKCSDEDKAVSCLPDKLKAEIAINVHLDTLKRVEIFQNTEAGFLCELVLRLRPVLFSPGDYICRKGEVGKEMYIVNRGRLQVVADNGKTVMASLKAGSYFGEISILNMGTAGNRRTASVRSVGYSDLFVLSKKDMWDVLKEYPAARVRLEAIAVKRLEKYKKAPLEKIAMGRCQSTPGLLESCGRTSCEAMELPPYPQTTNYSEPKVREQINGFDEINRRYKSLDMTRRPQSQPTQSGYLFSSNNRLECFCASSGLKTDGTTPLLGSHEAIEDEIRQLRVRLYTVESENLALTSKLSRQQWNFENRLAEIEMQMCSFSTSSSLNPEVETDEMERNRESVI